MDSLDWIWEDLNGSSKPAESTIAADEFDDGDDNVHDFHDRCDDDEGSDTSSDSSIGCWLLAGDKKTVRQLNAIADDIEKQQDGGKGNEKISESTRFTDDRGDESNTDTFYVDALEVIENELSEVRQLWSEALYACTVNGKNVPGSYTKTTSIEKLVLLYANDYVERFKINYPSRQLLLLHQNECGVQKCVCTTIKPSRLVYHDLNDLKSYSEFVAKHITYTKLEEPLIVPNKLVSPTMTLALQTANCFELATLLVSFLIGCEYNAFVVQGYAAENACNNDLRQIKLDGPKDNSQNEHSEPNNIRMPAENDAVKHTYDLCSEYVRFLIEDEKNKTFVQNEVKENDLICSSDPLYGKRVHCWVLIIMPAGTDDENSDKNSHFIEPSTGERRDISNDDYIGIESIWNHKNYWVNLQPLNGGCTGYDFTLTNTKCWERFLPEPHCLQKVIATLQGSPNSGNEITRPITMPNSWVNFLEVPRNKYLTLYPTGKKIVRFMNAVKEFYTDYVVPDGLIEKTTFYAGPDYTNKTFVKEIYKHRTDKLIGVEVKYTTGKIETTEYFNSGRKDCLKVHKFDGDGNSIETERSVTFYNLRLDSMVELKIDANSFTTLFTDRSDLLFWRKCAFQKIEANRNLNTKRKPMNIVEKYLRNKCKDKDRDIATRQFDFVTNEIFVQYHYGQGQITQSSRLFNRRSNATSSSDKFDTESVIENMVYPYEGKSKPYEAYLLLQDMIKAENEALGEISQLEDCIIEMLETRSRERLEFELKMDSLDWDRNHRTRRLLRNERDKKLGLAKQDNAKQTEYALPCFETEKKQSFTNDTALNVRDEILNDFRRKTKYQFMRAKTLFTEKQSEFRCAVTEALEINSADEFEPENKSMALCSSLKYKLDALMLKMERYGETNVRKYDDLCSYLNSNVDFETLPPLKTSGL